MPLEITLKELDLKEFGFNKIITAEKIINLKDPILKSQAIILDTKKEDTLKVVQKFSKPSSLIIVQAHDATFNRTLLETRKINILLNPELYAKKDRLYERDSGLNHILCKIAKENNIAIATDLKILIQKEKAENLK